MIKYFVGIDVARRSHVLGIRDTAGNTVGNILKFVNTQAGFEMVRKRFSTLRVSQKEILVGIEVSGNFWEALYDYLQSKNYQVVLLSPYCTDKYRKMAKCGSPYARHALYLASVACLKHNPHLRQLYTKKVNEGKAPIQALVVVSRKLLQIIYSMLKYDTAFDPARLYVNNVELST